jgi:HSP20 family protein
MTLVRWKPFGDLISMHDKINRLFEDAFQKDVDKYQDSLTSWYPAADIYETKNDYVFKLEIPGLSKEDINIECNGNTLSIKGEKKEETEVKKENYHRIESYCGTFARSFNLPKNVNPNKIDAAMKDGILELRIAKAEEKKTKAIPITVK